MKYAVTWLFLLVAATVFLFAWQEGAVRYLGKSTVEALAWTLFAVWIGMAALGFRLRRCDGGTEIMVVSIGFLAWFLITLVSGFSGY